VSRTRKILIGIVVIVIVAGVIAYLERPQDHTAPASVGAAVSAFKAQGAEAAEDVAGFPPSGVYTYALRGEEHLSAAIFGQTHPYEGVASMTVEPVACGVRETLQLLTTRWNEFISCPAGEGERIVVAGEHHEFFGTTSEVAYRCHGSGPAPGDYRPGADWVTSCAGSGGTLKLESEALRSKPMTVAGEKVPAVEIRSSVEFEGEVTGSSAVDEWRRESDGLVLERTAETNASVDVLGGGSYEETYTVTVTSLEPRQ
jgi:hypothetical protein